MPRSACAWAATVSPAWMVPLMVQGGLKPVMPVPGLTPTSPVIADAPVQVTVEAPRTAKPEAAPSAGLEDVSRACALALVISPQPARASSERTAVVLVRFEMKVDFE